MKKLNIAVVGSGISGLSAAWLLSKNHSVTLFEAEDRIGGHTNTVDMDVDGQIVPVDTGFICFNEANYPNLTAFLKHLDVATDPTNMSFSASIGDGCYEYSGGTYHGLFGQPRNLFRPRHWRMIRDLLRFFREAVSYLDDITPQTTLGQLLAMKGYNRQFADDHLIPMAAAIWSSAPGNMLDYPAAAFIRFFANHNLLQASTRPLWATVASGSRTYLDRIFERSEITVKAASPVREIRRFGNRVELDTAQGHTHFFDQVVIASHADQALAMLAQPSAEERRLLGKFRYSANHAVLHRDRRWMPKRRLCWASWNYLEFGKRVSGRPAELCLTYWMNSLQTLQTKENIFVTLNPPEGKPISRVAARFDYSHPVFDTSALEAQQQLWSLQGVDRTWFCGAHFGSGFHEDGLQAGLAVAEQLGGMRRPWNVENESGRIFVGEREAIVSEAAE